MPVDGDGRYVDAAGLVWHVCRNLDLSGCTWLAPLEGGQCSACDLTRTRPGDDDPIGLVNLPDAERAKRHLVFELDGLGFRVDGLVFDLLSSVAENVVIGHEDGVITIDLAESDAAHREKVRSKLAEPYRTMLGHFRHEVGHYFEWQLVRGDDLMARCRELFGDESADYQEALDRHYAEGAPEGWEAFVHLDLRDHAPVRGLRRDVGALPPHLRHRRDRRRVRPHRRRAGRGVSSFRDVVTGVWVPVTVALNMINRSMGKDDLYPFVIPAPVLDKLDFVASLPRSP